MSHQAIFAAEHLSSLFVALSRRGYQIVGPTVRDGAIVYDPLSSVEDLPMGWTDQQEGGTYRLQKRDDKAWFGFAVGPHSWKRFVYPAELRLWRAQRQDGQIQFLADEADTPKYAFIGVRSCELHAIAIQDKVLMQGPHVDATYAARRQQIFTVAVNCAQAGGTCFCVSMQTGPRVTHGYDLALTEILDANRHVFMVDVGSPLGAEVLGDVPHRVAQAEEVHTAARIVTHTATQMGRTLDTTEIQALLYGNLQHPRWDEVATRCLSCGNCTMVCPTCFCTTVEDVTDLSGQQAERWRRWDSCFTQDFSYIHGGSVRPSTPARYRQWLTHKLATWIDQFGTSGCVGCGRCITWCPVAIDITEEVRAIRDSDTRSTPAAEAHADAHPQP